MSTMNSIERIDAVLAGQQPDRPAYSFWYHFAPEQSKGQAVVDAHLNHYERYKPDFLKVMNDNEYPSRHKINTAKDLRNLPVLKGDEEGYGLQLDLLKVLSSQLKGKVYLVTTLFNAWTILRRIVTPRTSNKHNPPVLDGQPNPVDTRMNELLGEDRTSMSMALDVIAASQANFAKKCIEAGADGIFLSVRDDWINTPQNGMTTYEELVEIGDGQILTAANRARLNVLHVCGNPQNLMRFADYPVQVINWADRAAGPEIDEIIGKIDPVICGGVDNLSTLPDGTPEDVAHEVREVLQLANERPLIVGPGCTFNPDYVPSANLDAIVRTAQNWPG